MTTERPKITIYSTSWCSYCHSLMHWLDQKGIDYQEVDVEADTAAEAELLRLTNGEFTVPVTTIGNETILGFDRPAVLAALKKPKV